MLATFTMYVNKNCMTQSSLNIIEIQMSMSLINMDCLFRCLFEPFYRVPSNPDCTERSFICKLKIKLGNKQTFANKGKETIKVCLK